MMAACEACLRRTALIADLAGRIEHEWRLRRGRPQLLGLSDEALLRWSGEPDVARRHSGFRADLATDRLLAAGLDAVCRCSSAYPPGLHELPDPPAVLHLRGARRLLAGHGVAVVGARRASSYGLELARALGRGLAAAGVPVVSGMAMGIDSAAHAGALEAAGPTVAVLATGADRPYPARSRGLHARIGVDGCLVSELPPGFEPRRWAFPARNRLIAALSAGTVVVEGGERSGSLITADFAADLGRFVAAVPGPVTSSLAAGPHALLKAGAELVRGAADVLDLLADVPRADALPLIVGRGDRPKPAPPAVVPIAADLGPRLRALLGRIERGGDSLATLTTDPAQALALSRDLGELELRGLIRRVDGGRYIRAAG